MKKALIKVSLIQIIMSDRESEKNEQTKNSGICLEVTKIVEKQNSNCP